MQDTQSSVVRLEQIAGALVIVAIFYALFRALRGNN